MTEINKIEQACKDRQWEKDFDAIGSAKDCVTCLSDTKSFIRTALTHFYNEIADNYARGENIHTVLKRWIGGSK